VGVRLTAIKHYAPKTVQRIVDVLPVQKANTRYRLQMKSPNAYGKRGHQHKLPPIIVCIITRQYDSKPCIGGCTGTSLIL
jgi:hypothetical protein